MIKNDDLILADAEPDPAFLKLTDQISEQLQADDEIDVRDYLRSYPQWADAILKLLPTMNDLVEYGRAIDRERGCRKMTDKSPETPGHKMEAIP